MEWGRVEHFLVVRISNGSCVNPVMQIVAIHVLFQSICVCYQLPRPRAKCPKRLYSLNIFLKAEAVSGGARVPCVRSRAKLHAAALSDIFMFGYFQRRSVFLCTGPAAQVSKSLQARATIPCHPVGRHLLIDRQPTIC